uniref:Annexin n=1 Tax=Solanum lycopersicum TaxID=4081 RepID=A0A3Q7F6Z1_SOLLC
MGEERGLWFWDPRAKLNEDLAKSEAKVFVNALAKKTNLIEDKEIVRILSIRSKLHLKAIYSRYKEMSGNSSSFQINNLFFYFQAYSLY